MWARAGVLAARTPATRNRYADFMRAASIIVVIVGHWLVAAPYLVDGQWMPGVLDQQVGITQWVTWLVQVMPIFFLVGGYSHAAAWRSARRRGTTYGAFLGGRLSRLIGPTLPLVVFWMGFAVVARIIAFDGTLLEITSHAGLIPVWFLTVYVVIAAATPLTHALWERFGVGSIAGLIAAALVVDVVAFNLIPAVGWINFIFVWFAIHQLGYAWFDGVFDRPRRSLALAAVALVVLVPMVTAGPYLIGMVGVPGGGGANNNPPTLALLALGLVQTGLLLAASAPMRRWLEGRRVWTVTILVNGMIMALYLWHLTALVMLVLASRAVGDVGPGLIPGTALWWATRPVWIAVLALAMVPFLMFRRFDRVQPVERMSTLAAIGATALASYGLTGLATGGIGNETEWLRTMWVLPALAGAVIVRASTRQVS